MATVEIYTTAFCPYCFRAKRLLKSKGVPFTEYDVTMEPAERRNMAIRANGRHTVPQIFIDDTPIGGCDELHQLEEDGALDAMLTSK
ncbi:MAG: glutaredoxin 3 [Magnetospiraceae bacterium]